MICLSGRLCSDHIASILEGTGVRWLTRPPHACCPPCQAAGSTETFFCQWLQWRLRLYSSGISWEKWLTPWPAVSPTEEEFKQQVSRVGRAVQAIEAAAKGTQSLKTMTEPSVLQLPARVWRTLTDMTPDCNYSAKTGTRMGKIRKRQNLKSSPTGPSCHCVRNALSLQKLEKEHQQGRCGD